MPRREMIQPYSPEIEEEPSTTHTPVEINNASPGAWDNLLRFLYLHKRVLSIIFSIFCFLSAVFCLGVGVHFREFVYLGFGIVLMLIMVFVICITYFENLLSSISTENIRTGINNAWQHYMERFDHDTVLQAMNRSVEDNAVGHVMMIESARPGELDEVYSDVDEVRSDIVEVRSVAQTASPAESAPCTPCQSIDDTVVTRARSRQNRGSVQSLPDVE